MACWVTPRPAASLTGAHRALAENAFFEMRFHESTAGFFSSLLGTPRCFYFTRFNYYYFLKFCFDWL